MVAGMLMPRDDLKAIYEHLFRDGVMVAKKDKRPQTRHPEIPGVQNLHVIRVMGSLKSRGYVTETFAWRHFYWYLTNEGIAYLRDYLHLPPEITPKPLQRVRRTIATLPITRRAEHVQAIQGPTSYVPKPGKMVADEQDSFQDRQAYRRKMTSTDDFDEATPRFRGHPVAGTQIKPKGSWESQDKPNREMEPSVRRKLASHSFSQMPSVHSARDKPAQLEKSSIVQKSSEHVQSVSSTIEATMTSSFLSEHPEALKQKPKEGIFISVCDDSAPKGENKDDSCVIPAKLEPQKTALIKKIEKMPTFTSLEGNNGLDSSLISEKEKSGNFSQGTTSTHERERAKDVRKPLPKVQEEKQQNMSEVKHLQDVSKSSKKPKEITFVKDSETSTAAQLSSSEMKKTLQTRKTNNGQNVPAHLEFSDSAEDVKQIPKAVSKEDTSKEYLRDIPQLKPKDEKRLKTKKNKDVNDGTLVEKTVEKLSVSLVSAEAVEEKSQKEVCVNVTQEKLLHSDGKIEKDAPHLLESHAVPEKTEQTKKDRKIYSVAVDSTNTEATARESSESLVTSDVIKKLSSEELVKVSQVSMGGSILESATTKLQLGKTGENKKSKKPNTEEDTTVIQPPASAESGKDKSKEEATLGVNKPDKDEHHDNMQDKPLVEERVMKASVSSISTKVVKEKPAITCKEASSAGHQDNPSASSKTVEKKQITKMAIQNKEDVPSQGQETRVIVSEETTSEAERKPDEDAGRSSQSEPNITMSSKVQDVPNFSSVVEMALGEQAVSISQKTTSESCSHSADSKPNADKTPKIVENLNRQDSSSVTSIEEMIEVKTTVSPVITEAKVKDEPEGCVTGSQEDSDYSAPSHSKVKVEKSKKSKKKKNVQDVPTLSAPKQSGSISFGVVEEKAKEEALEEVPQDSACTVISESKLEKDAPCSAPLKNKKQKTPNSNQEQEQPIKLAKLQEASVQPEEKKPSGIITPQVRSAMPPLPKKEEGLAVQSSEKQTELCLPKPTIEFPVEKCLSNTVQVIDETLKADDHLTVQGNHGDPRNDGTSLLKVHEMMEIPLAISVLEGKVAVKGQDPNTPFPETDAEIKVTTTDTSKASEIMVQTSKKHSYTLTDSVDEKTSIPSEDVAVTGGETGETAKASRGKKKKQKSANKQSIAAKQVPPLKAEPEVSRTKTTAQVFQTAQVDLIETKDHGQVSTKDSAEGMHTAEVSGVLTAVQSKAPVHKAEEESEKWENLKGKTSSEWEAPASESVSAQRSLLPEQGDPPNVAQRTPPHIDSQRSTEKQSRLTAPAQPVIIRLDWDPCATRSQYTDDTMRKKIVVVEEVIEVQQVVSPVAGQTPAPPIPKAEGEDLDYDVLEELAIERGLLEDPDDEAFWDHSLLEPEDKTFPSFVEGMSLFIAIVAFLEGQTSTFPITVLCCY
ncbi:hypothetical protein DNTS_023749 [Danionella cerebrum]|uniref:Plectin/eS10 N-terminal domain-containing protein n=1 Tax=Danionella cerebrum TaxID=2873325 RepID=A0A553RFB1_9TELE|nr:hypothetical protein DNTS_023749 [Danionella translucida]